MVGVSRFGIKYLMPGSFAAECKSQLLGKRLKLFTETRITRCEKCEKEGTLCVTYIYMNLISNVI